MKTQKKLEKYSSEELAESFVFPIKQTKAEQEADAHILKKLREEKVIHMTKKQRFLFRILQLRFQLEDYVKKIKLTINRKY